MKNKNILIIIIGAVILIGLALYFTGALDNLFNNVNYEKELSKMEKLSTDEMIEKINTGDPFVILIGRNGCNACEESIKAIKDYREVVEKYEEKLYYNEIPLELSKEEKTYYESILKITSIPSIVVRDKGEFTPFGSDVLSFDNKSNAHITSLNIFKKLVGSLGEPPLYK